VSEADHNKCSSSKPCADCHKLFITSVVLSRPFVDWLVSEWPMQIITTGTSNDKYRELNVVGGQFVASTKVQHRGFHFSSVAFSLRYHTVLHVHCSLTLDTELSCYVFAN
jgi:hypothetical protein